MNKLLDSDFTHKTANPDSVPMFSRAGTGNTINYGIFKRKTLGSTKPDKKNADDG